MVVGFAVQAARLTRLRLSLETPRSAMEPVTLVCDRFSSCNNLRFICVMLPVTIGMWSSRRRTRFGKFFMSRTDPMSFGDDDKFKDVSVGAQISMMVPCTLSL